MRSATFSPIITRRGGSGSGGSMTDSRKLRRDAANIDVSFVAPPIGGTDPSYSGARGFTISSLRRESGHGIWPCNETE